MWKKYTQYILLPIVFSLGVFSYWVVNQPSEARLRKQECKKQYTLLSGDINCDTIDGKADQVESLHREITRLIEQEKADHHIVRASVFYRDLDSKRWFGVNDTDTFYPASLIKLPIAVTYYKIAELEPDIFKKQLQIAPDTPDNSDQNYPPAEPMEPGKYYTVQEMIRHMLVFSDNAPFTPLAEASGLFRDKVLSDLGIYQPPVGEGEGAWTVSARVYASIFRMLFNGSYLNIDYSQELLQTLSQSTFTKGLVAGVPQGVIVSHKFGEAVGTDKDGNTLTHILNDCGIIYKPKDPFILCVMTEGNVYSDMEKVIEKVAKTSYDRVE